MLSRLNDYFMATSNVQIITVFLNKQTKIAQRSNLSEYWCVMLDGELVRMASNRHAAICPTVPSYAHAPSKWMWHYSIRRRPKWTAERKYSTQLSLRTVLLVWLSSSQTSVSAGVCACMRACVRVRVRARACVRARVCVCELVCMYTCMRVLPVSQEEQIFAPNAQYESNSNQNHEQEILLSKKRKLEAFLALHRRSSKIKFKIFICS